MKVVQAGYKLVFYTSMRMAACFQQTAFLQDRTMHFTFTF